MNPRDLLPRPILLVDVGEPGFEDRRDRNLELMRAMLELSKSILRRRGVPEKFMVYVCVNGENRCGIFDYNEATVQDQITACADRLQSEVPQFRCFAVDGRKVDALLEVIRESPPTDEEIEEHRIRMGLAPPLSQNA